MSHRRLWWLPAASWAAFIFFLSTREMGTAPPPWFLSNDKVVHAVLFGVLAALVHLAARRAERWNVRRAAATALVMASLYGATDELHQLRTPTRSADPMDWVADTVGAALAVAAAAAVGRRQAGRP